MDIKNSLHIRDTMLINDVAKNQRKVDSTESLSANDIDGIDVTAHKKKQLKEVAQGFEKIFLNMMFSSMRDTLDKKQDILYGGFSQDIFEDMLYEKYADEVAATKALGFGKLIVSQYEQYL